MVDNDRSLVKAASNVQARWQPSFWDSLIVAAAQRCGATQLWSEHLSAGQRYGEVTVINPLQPS